MALAAQSSDPGIRLRPGVRVGAVVSLYHGELVGQMLESAAALLAGAGLPPEDLVVVQSPGAFELPLLAAALARREDIDAVLCFGLVLEGETSHDVHIARAAAEGIARASHESGKPVLFGVLTCETLEQARARALPASRGGKLDKGAEAARAALLALETLDRIASLPSKGDLACRTGPSPGRTGSPRSRKENR